MSDFTIGGIDYQSKLMDGETQTLVLKRLLPAFTSLVTHAPALRDTGGDNAEGGDGEAAEDASLHDVLMPVARELAALSDADVKFILDSCLQVTQRQITVGIGWAPVVQRGVVQDQTDAKFITRLTIAWHVLAENFGDMLKSFGLDTDKLSKAVPMGIG